MIQPHPTTNHISHSPSSNDTIAAIATPPGTAGIGIIRISGPQALEIARRIFQPKNTRDHFKSHRLYVGNLIDPRSGLILDEVLLSYMRAPHSYTREDVVEINSHSGYVLLSKILKTILSESVRLAEPGEFTFRAFSHGRIDLTQAEATMDLINAQSERGIHLASRHLQGDLRSEIELLREQVIEVLANIEVAIDFPDEESDIMNRQEMETHIVRDIIAPTKRIIASHNRRRVWLEGIATVIVGGVNVGKSSLLNRLLNEERAIVTPTPGTTRDVIESTILLEGMPLRLMDTAGIRKVEDEVERIGIMVAEQKLREADLIILDIDQSRPLNQYDFDLIARCHQTSGIVVVNKIDLASKIDATLFDRAIQGLPFVRISALTGEGIDDLVKVLIERILDTESTTTTPDLAPNLRQKTALASAVTAFETAHTNLQNGEPLDLAAVDMTIGLNALGEIIGLTSFDELYHKIFSRFCRGK